MNVIEAHGLTKTYARRCVVSEFDMCVREGDIYGFVGKNGAGKSTVMKMICGLVTPTSGSVKVFGAEVAGPGSTHAYEGPRVGALIEQPGIIGNLSAYENLMAKALALGVVDARGQCERLLRLVGLDHAGRKKTRRFSLGMRQRLGFALALVGSPDVLLLDEPLNGLDPEGVRDMRNLIMRLNQSLGTTVLISSHVLEQLDRMVTRYGVIAHGHLVREMTAEQVQAECEDSLRVRTANPARTLALLQDALPHVSMRVEPDGSLVISHSSDSTAVAEILHKSNQVILELSIHQRDIEEYFLALMDGGERYV